MSFGLTKEFSGFKVVIQGVSEATGKRKRLQILYKAVSTGRESKRKVDLFQVWATKDGFYLIGLHHRRNAVRSFAMDRIKILIVLYQCAF